MEMTPYRASSRRYRQREEVSYWPRADRGADRGYSLDASRIGTSAEERPGGRACW